MTWTKVKRLYRFWEKKHPESWFQIDTWDRGVYRLTWIQPDGTGETVHIGKAREIIAYLKGAVMDGCRAIHI